MYNARKVAAVCTIPAVVSALLLAAPAVRAAEQADQLEEIIVTGIRHSIEASIETKKLSEEIVEVATAEDIGKLPGVSIAETLARLPGVAAQRVDGRAQVISIRGMAPDFSVTLLNGQEMVSSGDDRSFEYDQFPAELVTAVTVYKTPDASLATNGLAGTVNLSTVSPLAAKGKKFNVSARLDDNAYGKLVPGTSATGNRLSASYIDRFADDTFGVALGLVHLNTPTNKKYFNPWDFGTAADVGVGGVPPDQLLYDGFETGVMNWKGVRDSAMAVLEFKPSEAFSSKLNVFHTQFDQDMNGRELIGVIADWGIGNVSPVVTQNNGANGLTVDNVVPMVTSRSDRRKDKIDQVTLNNQATVGAWSLGFDLGMSKGTRKQRTSEVYAALKTPVTITAVIPSGLDQWGSISSSTNFADPANFSYASFWWWGGGSVLERNIEDKMRNARLSAKRDLDWGVLNSLETGLVYSHREKGVHYTGIDMMLVNPDQNCLFAYGDGVTGCNPIPSGILQSPAGLGFAGVPGVISFDAEAALAGAGFTPSTDVARNPKWNWNVQESLVTAYLKTGFKFDLGIPFHGNVGLQIVRTDQSSNGTQDDGAGGMHPVNGGATYTDVLPSLNLVGNLGHGTLLKMGVAKVQARPELIYMRANFTASVGTTDHLWSGSGGNPTLKPWRANEFDLSLEKYYSPATYVAVATFYKQITSGVFVQSVPYNFAGFTNPTNISPKSDIGLLTAPANTSGGHVSGWELSGALDMGAVASGLKGFGLTGSFSHTTSNLPGYDIFGNKTTTSLPGLSGTVYDLTAYFEKEGWQFRVGQVYRSAYVAKRYNSFQNVVDAIRPERIVDAQLGYTFRSGALADLNLLLQVENLTDTPYVSTQTVNGIEALKERHAFGRQYLLGASYKF